MKILHALAALVLLATGLVGRLCSAGIGAPGNETLWKPLLKGPIQLDISSLANAFVGALSILSGSATGVVSTTLVNSDSVILHSALGNANVASGQFKGWEVKTITSGAAFTIGTADGQAVARDTTIFWFLLIPS